MDKLNQIISIDLHIHSKESEYKEEKNYVDSSNINNTDVLLKKLNDENINMFAITDHNRFDYALYSKLKLDLNLPSYPNVKCILPGIEFDVLIEENKESCHIICIFEDNEENKLKNINNVLIKNRLLTSDTDFYSRDEFEKILKDIGLSTILIAHQHKHFKTKTGGKRSLSNSVSDIYSFIRTGYVNALEYQRPDVQGMIINSLHEAQRNIATIIGSDCHQWQEYPKKDKDSPVREYVSKIKALPNFKGLVFSITSHETRFNRIKNNNKNYVKVIRCNNQKFELSNGLNAIIGDNGAGKTLLMELISGSSLNKNYSELQKINLLSIEAEGKPKIEYIRQGQIIDDVRKGSLFNNSKLVLYKDISTKETFKKRIKGYSEQLIKVIQNQINIVENEQALSNADIILENKDYSNFIPLAKIDINMKDNNYTERIEKLEEIYNSLLDEYTDNKGFYSKNKIKLSLIIKELDKSLTTLREKDNILNKRNELINIITSKLNDFNIKMNTNRSDKEKELVEYKNCKKAFSDAISKTIKLIKDTKKFPDFPKSMKGNTKNLYKGFSFTKKAEYDDLNLEDLFFQELFTKEYDKDSVLKINTNEELIDSLNGIKKIEDIASWYKKVDGFIEKYCNEETYIEKKSTKETMGNTPGEISIVFYDFKLQNTEEEISVFLIDQPEDDISNHKISKELISYINLIRDKKQTIMVTHNPMLVVNLDVDNVICINKDFKKVITIKSGCLEYEDENYRIIDEIAEKMDGGSETIKRRFKLYEN